MRVVFKRQRNLLNSESCAHTLKEWLDKTISNCAGSTAETLGVTLLLFLHWSYYEAGTPVLVTSDVDMAREILIKQFDKFDERRVNIVFVATHPKARFITTLVPGRKISFCSINFIRLLLSPIIVVVLCFSLLQTTQKRSSITWLIRKERNGRKFVVCPAQLSVQSAWNRFIIYSFVYTLKAENIKHRGNERSTAEWTPDFSWFQMSPLVHQSVDKLIARFEQRAEKGEAFDIAE